MSTLTRTPAIINLAAECRAIEEGHVCRLSADHKAFKVASHSDPGKTYTLTAFSFNDKLSVVCDCPWGEHNLPVPGIANCKHQSLVARRLTREGLVRFDHAQGLWVLTLFALSLLPKAEVKDPFDIPVVD